MAKRTRGTQRAKEHTAKKHAAKTSKMSARAAATVILGEPGETRLVEIAEIHVDRDHASASLDQASLDRLARSIAATGQQQAVAVCMREKGGYRLIFGRRRLTAMKQLGVATIRAAVYPPIGEPTIAAARAVENFDRAAIGPIEEAQSILAMCTSIEPKAAEMSVTELREKGVLDAVAKMIAGFAIYGALVGACALGVVGGLLVSGRRR